jgi:hypothetical protein
MDTMRDEIANSNDSGTFCDFYNFIDYLRSFFGHVCVNSSAFINFCRYFYTTGLGSQFNFPSQTSILPVTAAEVKVVLDLFLAISAPGGGNDDNHHVGRHHHQHDGGDQRFL